MNILVLPGFEGHHSYSKTEVSPVEVSHNVMRDFLKLPGSTKQALPELEERLVHGVRFRERWLFVRILSFGIC